MCGRYSLALVSDAFTQRHQPTPSQHPDIILQRPSQVRRILERDGMPVADWPADEGDDAPRQSYNFAPGYHGLVYRADTPDWGNGPAPGGTEQCEATAIQESHARGDDNCYKMQSMRWGLIPFWTKRNPGYGTVMKTINCRDDSLSSPGGMWASIKGRKRCIVIAQGFFEWLKNGPKDKVPHYVKRKDGHLMCFAGLWDCVQYQDSEEKTYTYTIITTDSNQQLKFLHDRMPVVLDPGSEGLRTWLDPTKSEWTRELQALLKPFGGELEVYPVNKDVGKVGNSSPSFIIPLDSKENKSNIVNFFSNAASQSKNKNASKAIESRVENSQKKERAEDQSAPLLHGKRKHSDVLGDGPPTTMTTASKSAQSKTGKRSATRNTNNKSLKESQRTPSSQKITKFFANSA
ncbi:hypothetical protein S40288_08891 [Stachybotrys chartarum IBT 40288]|nr:hypothetical protein S40288_08891 [Stachybotrys chartarum IBT 40288]